MSRHFLMLQMLHFFLDVLCLLLSIPRIVWADYGPRSQSKLYEWNQMHLSQFIYVSLHL